MKHPLADRLLLVFVLEVSTLLVVVSLAESALGVYLPPVAAAGLLIVLALAVPVVVWMPAFAARPDRLTRWTGVAVLALGASATLVRSHELPEITLLVVGGGLFTYAAHHRHRRSSSATDDLAAPADTA